MKRLLCLILAGSILGWLLAPQWNSFDRMAERRSLALHRPAKELVVGVCWPFESTQDGMGDGLKLAQEEINSQGLTGGPKIRLVLRDNHDDIERARKIALEFANTPQMSAVLGYYDDSLARKAAGIYDSSQLLYMLLGTNTTSLTASGSRYVIRTIAASDKIARSLAQMAVDRKYARYAVIWEDGAYGEDLAFQFRVAMDGLHAPVAYGRSYRRDQPDFRLMVNELKGIQADFVFFAGMEPWAGDFIRMARGVGLKLPILGAFSDTPQMRKRAGAAIEDAMYFDFYNPWGQSPENLAFVAKFRARFGRNPDAMAAQGYDGLHLLARAARTTSSRDCLDLAYAIRYMEPWTGANGTYHFNAQGEMDDKPIYLMQYQHGQAVMIQEGQRTTAPIIH